MKELSGLQLCGQVSVHLYFCLSLRPKSIFSAPIPGQLTIFGGLLSGFHNELLQAFAIFNPPLMETQHIRGSQAQTCEHKPAEETLKVSHSDFIRVNIWSAWCKWHFIVKPHSYSSQGVLKEFFTWALLCNFMVNFLHAIKCLLYTQVLFCPRFWNSKRFVEVWSSDILLILTYNLGFNLLWYLWNYIIQ